MIILGVAGLFAHLVVTIPPKSATSVMVGSWVVIGIGAVLLLTALARRGYGYGIFVLALGVGAVVAQKVVHFGDRIHAPQPLFGIVAVSLIGVGAIAVSFADGGYDAIFRLPFFAGASLLADLFVDFGSGWDGLMNVSTAFFSAASVVTVVVILEYDGFTNVISLMNYYGDGLVLAAGVGSGLAAVLATIVASFDLPSFVGFLLTSVAVLGGYLVIPCLGFLLLALLVGREAWSSVSADVLVEAIGSRQVLSVIGALVAGLVSVAALVAATFGGLAEGLVVFLVAVAAAAAAAAVRWGRRALTELAFVIRSAARPGRIAKVLEELRRTDVVFRLLPGAGRP